MIDLATISALIVEANPNMRTQLRNMLNMCGIGKVQFAVTAGVAVRKLRDGRYDLILCEYHIGDGQDGQHLLEDLRHNAIIPLSTLFIMVTGERQYERVVSAAELAPKQVGRMLDLAKFLARQGKYSESENTFTQAAKVAPESKQLLFARAEIYVETKRNLDTARQLLEQYLKSPLSPEDPPRQEARKLLRRISGD